MKAKTKPQATKKDDYLSSTAGSSDYNAYMMTEQRYCMKPYIDRKGAENLKLYKHSACDDGFAYIYFYSPLSEWIVSYLPDWVAPNTITLVGFCHTLAPIFILYFVIGTSMYGVTPDWFVYAQAWCYFIYRLLDEMDGKQARQTGNSSPLGMIFDHGCDCFAAGIQPLIFFRILNLGNNIIPKIMQVSIYSAFYFVTLEEYYSGYMYFPPFNAVSDGSVFVIGAMLTTAYLGGSNVWATPLIDGTWLNFDGVEILTAGQCLALLISVLSVAFAHFQVLKIIWYYWYPRKTQCEKVNFSMLAQQYLAFWLWVAIWFMFQYQGRDPIRISNPTVITNESARLANDEDDYGQSYMAIHHALFVTVIVAQTISIQFAHCTRSKFSPWTKIFTFALTSMVGISIVGVLRDGDVNFKLWSTLLCGVIAVSKWQFILSVIGEMTTILGIEVFVTKQEQQRRLVKRQQKAKAIRSKFEEDRKRTRGDEKPTTPEKQSAAIRKSFKSE